MPFAVEPDLHDTWSYYCQDKAGKPCVADFSWPFVDAAMATMGHRGSARSIPLLATRELTRFTLADPTAGVDGVQRHEDIALREVAPSNA